MTNDLAMLNVTLDENDFMKFIQNGKVIMNTWKKYENHLVYAKWLGKKLGYETIEDWYKIKKDIIVKNYGSGLLLTYYKNSPILFLRGIFPKHEWVEWKCCITSLTYWSNIENHKIYIKWLGKQLEYEKMEDWYNITIKLISKNYGGGLLSRYYNNSPFLFLKSIFPEYNWLEWKMSFTSNGFWKNIDNQRKYANWLGVTLGYKTMEDWYLINGIIINNNYGQGLINNYYNNSPILFLRGVYPEYEWLDWKLNMTSTVFWKDTNNKKKICYLVR
jgi:hypothetical protein